MEKRNVCCLEKGLNAASGMGGHVSLPFSALLKEAQVPMLINYS